MVRHERSPGGSWIIRSFSLHPLKNTFHGVPILRINEINAAENRRDIYYGSNDFVRILC